MVRPRARPMKEGLKRAPEGRGRAGARRGRGQGGRGDVRAGNVRGFSGRNRFDTRGAGISRVSTSGSGFLTGGRVLPVEEPLPPVRPVFPASPLELLLLAMLGPEGRGRVQIRGLTRRRRRG